MDIPAILLSLFARAKALSASLIAFLGVEPDCSSRAKEVVPNERDRVCRTSEAASGSRARRVVRMRASGEVFMTASVVVMGLGLRG